MVNQIKLKLYEYEMQNILSSINNSTMNPKLRTYKLFKVDYRLEPYLALNISCKMIKNIARFRTSSHNLRIETGRHERPMVPAENRLCQKCNLNEVEDEIHYLITCPAHSAERESLFSKVSSIIEDFLMLNKVERF